MAQNENVRLNISKEWKRRDFFIQTAQHPISTHCNLYPCIWFSGSGTGWNSCSRKRNDLPLSGSFAKKYPVLLLLCCSHNLPSSSQLLENAERCHALCTVQKKVFRIHRHFHSNTAKPRPPHTHPRFLIGRRSERGGPDHMLLTHVYKQAQSGTERPDRERGFTASHFPFRSSPLSFMKR